MILPPAYRSTASMLVEPQQIPDELAETTVAVDPYEQAQIIEQRLMTRANLLELAERVGLYADQPEMSANAIVGDMRSRIEFIGFEPDVTRRPGMPGATIIGVAFEAPTAELANKGANELVEPGAAGERAAARRARRRHAGVLRGRDRPAGRPSSSASRSRSPTSRPPTSTRCPTA